LSVHGDKLGAELSALYALGRYVLPTLAQTYAVANNYVARTSHNDDAAFTHYGSVGQPYAGMAGSFATEWMNIRDELQNFLGRGSHNIERAGEAMVSIADNYAETDDEAARKLHSIWYAHGQGRQERLHLPSEYHDNNPVAKLPDDPPGVIMAKRAAVST
jgi:hypothetical protein